MNMAAFKEFIKFPFYVMVRPFTAFEDIKYGERGSKKYIIVSILLMWVAIAFNTQYAGIVVNENNPMTMNSISDLYGVIAVFVLWCVGNWSITSLMDGEGKLIQIATATSYALTPFFLGYFVATLLSRFITTQEVAFYTMIITIVTIWAAFLLFAAVATIHNFSFVKALATIFFSFVSMIIIIFLIMLIGALLQQVFFFFENVYKELTYRI
ncbi:MAG: YIP1 family protein [Defluviitaleaceae bacterium]|nr:YIP1 family protein [Defluviitaleaceae bacterium]